MESWTRSRSSQRSLTCRTQLRVLKLKLLKLERYISETRKQILQQKLLRKLSWRGDGLVHIKTAAEA